MSWADVSSEDAAEGDDASDGVAGYEADPADIAEAATDPSIAVSVDGIDPLAALGIVDAAATPILSLLRPRSRPR